MKNVFHVTIHYHDDTVEELNVTTSGDDLSARKAAINEDAKSFKMENIKAPIVDFCEVKFVCEAITA